MSKNKEEKKEYNQKTQNGEENNVENETADVTESAENEAVCEENECSNEEELSNEDNSEVQLLTALKEINELKSQISSADDRYLRLRAEFENYRKRTLSEAERSKIKGIGAALEAFFPAMDGIDRALTLCKDEGITKGILLVKKQFQNALIALGVTEINPEDEEFNPEFHNAVMNEVNPEKAGKVIEVFQRGYIYKEIVLRPAMVKVGIEE